MGFTLKDYSDLKSLPVNFLKSLGLYTHDDRCVAIPYYDTSGNVVRTQYRTSDRFWWDKGTKVLPYGLNQLGDCKKRALLVVEGASDAQTAWYHGLCAMGVPGANSWKSSWKDYVSRFKVYVWHEPDTGGDQLVETLSRDIDIWSIQSQDYKDISDLHTSNPDNVIQELRGLVGEAKRHTRTPQQHGDGCRCRLCVIKRNKRRLDGPRARRAQHLNILDVVSMLELGHPKRRGNEYVMKCPFHGDTDPSLYMDPSDNVWFCFGCASGGDTIEMWKTARNVPFKQAINEMTR